MVKLMYNFKKSDKVSLKQKMQLPLDFTFWSNIEIALLFCCFLPTFENKIWSPEGRETIEHFILKSMYYDLFFWWLQMAFISSYIFTRFRFKSFIYLELLEAPGPTLK